MKKGRVAGLESSLACGSSAQETRNKNSLRLYISFPSLLFPSPFSLSPSLSSKAHQHSTPSCEIISCVCADLFIPTQ